MKKNILFLLFTIASIAAFGQAGSLSQSVYRSRVNDSTSVVPSDAQGYGSLYWNNQATNPGWRVWVDGVGYVIWDPTASGSGGTTIYTGNGTLSGNRTVNAGGHSFTINNASGINLAGGVNSIVATGLFSNGVTDLSTFYNGVYADTDSVTITAAEDPTNDIYSGVTLAQDGSINFLFSGPVKLNGDTGSDGQVPTVQSDGSWGFETPSGGGGSPGGSDTQVQYNDVGSFGGDAGMTYNESTDILTVGGMINTSSSLTDGAAITVTGAKHTLTTDEGGITFTISYTGDEIKMKVIFNTTSATWTFPAGALCTVEGVAQGTNTAPVTGVSGDTFIVNIENWGSGVYSVFVKNIGQ